LHVSLHVWLAAAASFRQLPGVLHRRRSEALLSGAEQQVQRTSTPFTLV